MSYTLLGSGFFGAQFLKYAETKPDLVITSPDTFGGRGMTTRIPTPVKIQSQQLNLQTKEIDKVSYLKGRIPIPEKMPVIVVDFGMLIPNSLIKKCKYGIWNIHPSLLPRYRGPTPIQSALVNGEKETGVSIIAIDEQIDHGPLLNLPSGTPAFTKVTIGPNDTNKSLTTLLAQSAGKLIELLLSDPTASTAHMHQQDHARASFTHRFEKKDGYVPFEELSPYLDTLFNRYNLTHLLFPQLTGAPFCTMQKAHALHNTIRGLNPWPGIFSTLPNGKHIKILSSQKKDISMSITRVQIESKIYQ